MITHIKIEDFEYSVATDRVKIVGGAIDQFFRYSAQNQRFFTSDRHLEITLFRVNQEHLINEKYHEVGRCDLTLVFKTLTFFSSFIQEIAGVGYKEIKSK